ncbi:glutathione S-transferase family protein [Aestuariibacter sp. AA17]|uniref:Glutathione S-transferase family protein n=1 Tax=Fluctibacter corallii TaxID=2984329 RepID=A0ABT3AC93_9ALTE|nr:glutathione S-transferase family protein [Aestuariibacter sp. AA17]MCV2886294.1 glutathione S-transferase family protein [Aestuariibacter sp. AA17]
MKIYDTHTAPTPRRVRIFLAEKNISVEYVQVDIQKGENRTAEMREKNPLGKVPVLELDDGICIAESDAICRYFEAIQPEPYLMGESPKEQGLVAMWQRQVEMGLFNQIGLCFQHTTGYFKDRMTPFPDFGEDCRTNAKKYLSLLEKRLDGRTYIMGENVTIVDITALCAIDFGRVVDVRLNEGMPNLQRWHATMSSRPSAKA